MSVSLYEIASSWGGYSAGDLVARSEKGATSVSVGINPEINPYGGDSQTLVQYVANASNEAGAGEYAVTESVVVGPTISVPFKESMAEGSVENGLVWVEDNAERYDMAVWQLVTDGSADGDGGAAMWMPYTDDYTYMEYTIEAGDKASLNMPKISVADAANPILFFSLYSKANESASLSVNIQKADGSEETAATFDLSLRDDEGWETEKVDLSAYTSERYIIVKFCGESDGEDTYIGIDDINIIDQMGYDLEALSVSTPKKATAGATANVVVGIRNIGVEEAKDFNVVLYRDGEAVDTKTVTEALPSMATTSVVMSLPVPITAAEGVSVSATVIYDMDQNEENNTTGTSSVSVVQPTYVTVSDLTADRNEGVELSWTVPERTPSEIVTETFEEYDNFVTEFGDWTTIDDTENTINGAFISFCAYEHEEEPFAYIVFNASEYGVDEWGDEYNALIEYPGFAAHEGDKFLASPYKYSTETWDPMDADCWLISPELPGKSQTITFYAYNTNNQDDIITAESFEVLSSSTDKEEGSFTKIGDTFTVAGELPKEEGPNWEEFSVTLPEGAKYFAIRQVTAWDLALLFGLDDITFEKANNMDSIVGYNIYRDGEFLTSVEGTSYTDTDDDGEAHTYNVTVVYEDASGTRYESGFSNDATIVSGIAAIEATLRAASYDVYTLDGRVVAQGTKTLTGLKKGIHIINNKKFIVK